jgi:hypothetical protein
LNEDEARAVEEVSAALQGYKEPVTLDRFMLDHKERFKDARSVMAAVELLAEDGKVTIYVQRK